MKRQKGKDLLHSTRTNTNGSFSRRNPYELFRRCAALVFSSVLVISQGCANTPSRHSSTSMFAKLPDRTDADALFKALSPNLVRLAGVPAAFLNQLRTQVKHLDKAQFPDEEELHIAFKSLDKTGREGFALRSLQAAAREKLDVTAPQAKHYFTSKSYQMLQARLSQLRTAPGQAQLMAFLQRLTKDPPSITRLEQLKQLLLRSDEVERITQVTWDATLAWTTLVSPYLPSPLNAQKRQTHDEKASFRASFVARVQRTSLIELDYVFRELGDEELRVHLDFWRSAAGVQTAILLRNTLHFTMQSALEKCRKSLGDDDKKRKHPLEKQAAPKTKTTSGPQ
ncbi:MAG: hypothetical protein GY822_09420 [Deltaproteobacteria bacterium]|nr:hypothetical protein [Deltaproteobacteria bacterium]